MPNPFVYAVLSLDVYGGEDRVPLPEGWSVYCTSSAHRPSSVSGYYGTAYINHDAREIVIAHRGTVLFNVFDILSDIQIWLKRLPHDWVKARGFAQAVIGKCKEDGYDSYTKSTTGHSLGACLADLTLADYHELGLDASTTFENPGSKSLIVALGAQGQLPVGGAEYAKGKTTVYNTQPNLINTAEEQTGTVRRVFADYPLQRGEDGVKELTGYPDFFFKFTLPQHRMAGIYTQFNQVTGELAVHAAESQTWLQGYKAARHNYISYDQNPHYWYGAIRNNWEANGSPGRFSDYLVEMIEMCQLSRDGAVEDATGVTLYADDSAGVVWGTTMARDRVEVAGGSWSVYGYGDNEYDLSKNNLQGVMLFNRDAPGKRRGRIYVDGELLDGFAELQDPGVVGTQEVFRITASGSVYTLSRDLSQARREPRALDSAEMDGDDVVVKWDNSVSSITLKDFLGGQYGTALMRKIEIPDVYAAVQGGRACCNRPAHIVLSKKQVVLLHYMQVTDPFRIYFGGNLYDIPSRSVLSSFVIDDMIDWDYTDYIIAPISGVHLTTDGYATCWIRTVDQAFHYAHFCRVYSAEGISLTDAFLVSSFSIDENNDKGGPYAFGPLMTALSDGKFVVATIGADSTFKPYLQIYSSQGVSLGNRLHPSHDTTAADCQADVLAMYYAAAIGSCERKGFMFAWAEYVYGDANNDDRVTYFYQAYDEAGQTLATRQKLASFDSEFIAWPPQALSITGLTDDRYIVQWTRYPVTNSDLLEETWQQLFSYDGKPLTQPFQIMLDDGPYVAHANLPKGRHFMPLNDGAFVAASSPLAFCPYNLSATRIYPFIAHPFPGGDQYFAPIPNVGFSISQQGDKGVNLVTVEVAALTEANTNLPSVRREQVNLSDSVSQARRNQGRVAETSAQPLEDQAHFELKGSAPEAWSGYSVAGLPNFMGPGEDAVAIGAPGSFFAKNCTGAVYIMPSSKAIKSGGEVDLNVRDGSVIAITGGSFEKISR